MQALHPALSYFTLGFVKTPQIIPLGFIIKRLFIPLDFVEYLQKSLAIHQK